MIKDKLTTEYTLTIRPDYQGLIPLVAAMNGYEGEGDPKDFLANHINNLVKNEVRCLIKSSLEKYYGVSQAALIVQALDAYDNSAVAETSWEVIEEE